MQIINKLYGVTKIYKERIDYDLTDKTKVEDKTSSYGWIDNNRLINVFKVYFPSIDKIEDWRYSFADFTDLELKEKFNLNKKIADSLSSKKEDEEKSKKIFK